MDAPARAPKSAHCRITVGDGSAGSGTLVARNELAGLVLTCSHLFDQSSANVFVTFPDGQQFAARVLERDRAHDLAALVIHRPAVEPIDVSCDDLVSNEQLSACGYGGNGQFHSVRGEVVGQATPVGATHPSITIRGSVRPGDSGGGVLNARGLLVGVVWGERDGLTYITCGAPLRALLTRVVGKSRASSAESLEPVEAGLSERVASIERRVAALDAAKQNKGEYLRADSLKDFVRRDELTALKAKELVRRGELDDYTKREQVDSEQQNLAARFTAIRARVEEVRGRVEQVAALKTGLLQGLSMGKLIAGALGLSGPLAVGVIVAGGLAGRRIRSQRTRGKSGSDAPALASRPSTLDSHPIAIDTPPPPQQTVTETHYVPYETDSFAKAHGWASEQVARKYPGATELLQAQASLIKQFLTATHQS